MGEVIDDLRAFAPVQVQRFDDDERRRWAANGEVLLRRATWEAARDFELTDEMRLTIASAAAVLTAGFEPDSYPFENVAAIVVHPRTIVQPRRTGAIFAGVNTGGPLHAAGLAMGERGPVVLDWRTIRWQRANPQAAQNVIFHEFAHKLDYLNGQADGMPPLPPEEQSEWLQTVGTNYRRLVRRGSDGLIDGYGATNPAEFFAVLTEVFFTRPRELSERHPRLYARLSSFYQQDPAQ